MKVSVIIPIYNAMEYLPISLEKVLNQTYHNIEILLVDNNSKDGSYDYIKTLEKNDCRVKALIATMQGPNYARKVGFEASTGDYVLFCDSDDFVEQDAIENFVGKLEETNADIVITISSPILDVIKKLSFIKSLLNILFQRAGFM